MTFYELLNKFSIEELWYILKNRHNLINKPIKAERIFNLYKLARKELLSLHADNNYDKNVLACEFTIENDSGGAPDSWIHCNLLSPNENNNGEMQHYAMSFIPWNELIDCKVSEDSLVKLGALVCTAELLWEITFYGYSQNVVASESEYLRRLINDIDSSDVEMHSFNPDDWKPNKEETIMKEKTISEWLKNMPEKVKSIIFGFFAADVCGLHEDVDDITVEDVRKRLEWVIKASSSDTADGEKYSELLRSLMDGLDVNNQYVLLSKLYE